MVCDKICSLSLFTFTYIGAVLRRCNLQSFNPMTKVPKDNYILYKMSYGAHRGNGQMT